MKKLIFVSVAWVLAAAFPVAQTPRTHDLSSCRKCPLGVLDPTVKPVLRIPSGIRFGSRPWSRGLQRFESDRRSRGGNTGRVEGGREYGQGARSRRSSPDRPRLDRRRRAGDMLEVEDRVLSFFIRTASAGSFPTTVRFRRLPVRGFKLVRFKRPRRDRRIRSRSQFETGSVLWLDRRGAEPAGRPHIERPPGPHAGKSRQQGARRPDPHSICPCMLRARCSPWETATPCRATARLP